MTTRTECSNWRLEGLVPGLLAAAVACVAVGCGPRGSVGGGGSGTGTTTSTPDLPPDVGSDLPPPPVCGDGEVNGSEQCDDGNTEDGDGCQADCTYPPYHGQRIVAGESCVCVLMEGDRLRCWGAGGGCPEDSVEVYGDDEPAALAGDQPLPEPVVQLSPAYLGGCAVMKSGAVRCHGCCWDILGYPGGDAALGQGTPDVQEHASDLEDSFVIPLPGPARQVAFGGLHGCAVLESGELYCWGYNARGQLGLGHTETIGDDETPLDAGPVDVGGKVTEVAIGMLGNHTCVLLEGGAVRCFGAQVEDPLYCGWNVPPENCVNTGVLGTGVRENVGDDEVPSSVSPVDIGGPAVQVDVTLWESCALREDGALYCWGWGYVDEEFGILGDDESPVVGGPRPVATDVVTRFTLDDGHLAVQGAVSGEWWMKGQVPLLLGLTEAGTGEAIALHEVWGQGVVGFAAGTYHACVLLADGSVRCMGSNREGALGYGDIDGDGRQVCHIGCDESFGNEMNPTECCKGDDEPLSELPPVPYE